MIITYKQCKAARELLGWSRDDLVKKSGIGASSLDDFERGARNLSVNNINKILHAFETHGADFKNSDGEVRVSIFEKKK
jgi:transcriptional regulator with XRE-family HTH domain